MRKVVNLSWIPHPRLKAALFKGMMNLFPAYRGSGGRVLRIAPDFREVRVCVRLNWRTRNYVGVIFGGSLYAATDPMYMLMLMENLGDGYIVWDKAATIRFKKPGRGRVTGVFRITEDDLASIRRQAEDGRPFDRVFRAALTDEQGAVVAEVEKTVYIRKANRA